MSDTIRIPWMTGWTADDPLQIGSTRVDVDWGAWEPGAPGQFDYRDLGLADASARKMGCRHLRATRNPEPDGERWLANDLDFQFLYVLRGSLTLGLDDGAQISLATESSICIPGLCRHEIREYSDNFEAVEIAAPASFDTIWGRESPLPARVAQLPANRRPVVTHETPDQYVTGAGPRSFFEYRHLGTQAVTDGRIHIHVVHALGTPQPTGTGWHYHSMAQWFMVVGGTADIRVEQQPRKHLQPIDCMCIGAGPTMRHNVDHVSGDYKVLEMCVPAEYTTTPVPEPPGAAT